MGEPWRQPSSARLDRPLPHGDPLSRPRPARRPLRRVVEAGIPITGASDHGVSEAVYLNDPDRNGVELYRDRPREEWPRDPDGGVAMMSIPLDLDALLAEAP